MWPAQNDEFYMQREVCCVPALGTCVCVGELRVEVLIWRLWRRKLLLQTESRHQLLKEDTRPIAVPAETAHDVLGRTTCTDTERERDWASWGQVTKSNTSIQQQCGIALTVHWPTTRKYWSNSPTLTDSSSDSLMERQQHRQMSGSPESIMSNTDRDGEIFTKLKVCRKR